MTSSSRDMTELVRYWWEKAERSLASAEYEYTMEAYDFAINRLYYSAFYAVSAWLIEKRHNFKKHSGARGLFHQEMIKTGVLPKKWAKFYDRLFEDRTDSDYVPMTEFEASYVQIQIKECREFLEELQPLIEALK
jgi:uncharacterized protein (UPF0332 family)